MIEQKPVFHSSHWGAFTASPGADGLNIRPYEGDPKSQSDARELYRYAQPYRSYWTNPWYEKGWLETVR